MPKFGANLNKLKKLAGVSIQWFKISNWDQTCEQCFPVLFIDDYITMNLAHLINIHLDL